VRVWGLGLLLGKLTFLILGEKKIEIERSLKDVKYNLFLKYFEHSYCNNIWLF